MAREKIIRDALNFSAGNYIANIFDFVVGLVVRKTLGPASMGVVMELMLLFNYGKSHDLGVLNALDREIPILNGKKEYEKAKLVGNIGLTSCLATSVLLFTGLMLYSFFCSSIHDPRIINGIRIVALLNLFQALVSFYIVVIRTHHKFNILSRYLVFMGMMNLLLSVLLTIWFGFYGFLASLLLLVCARAIYLFVASGLRYKLVLPFPFKGLKALLKIGFPIFLSGFIFMTMQNVDRFMIIAFLDRVDLGYYSIAAMMHGYIFQLPNLIYAVLFPSFYEAFGREGDIQRVKNHYLLPTVIFAYLFPVLIGSAVLGLPLILQFILPKYLPGLFPAILLMLGTFFISISYMSAFLLTALDKQKFVAMLGALIVVANIVMSFTFLKILHFGLEGVALATAGSYFIYSLCLILFATSHYRMSFLEQAKFLLTLYAPFAWSLVLLAGVNLAFGGLYSGAGIMRSIYIFLLQLAVFILGCLPLMIYINKKTALFKTIFQMVRGKLGWNA